MFGLLKYAKIIETNYPRSSLQIFRSLFRVSLALIHGSLSRCRYSSKRPTDCHKMALWMLVMSLVGLFLS